jgi:hypothetical protein
VCEVVNFIVIFHTFSPLVLLFSCFFFCYRSAIVDLEKISSTDINFKILNNNKIIFKVFRRPSYD